VIARTARCRAPLVVGLAVAMAVLISVGSLLIHQC
jgi:hypothetical protein